MHSYAGGGVGGGGDGDGGGGGGGGGSGGGGGDDDDGDGGDDDDHGGGGGNDAKCIIQMPTTSPCPSRLTLSRKTPLRILFSPKNHPSKATRSHLQPEP